MDSLKDYILWMTKEAKGVQRLDKEVAGLTRRRESLPELVGGGHWCFCYDELL